MNINTAAEIAGIRYDDAAILQSAHVKLLLAAAQGRIDLNAIAREELACRGLGAAGEWVGFEAAARIWAAWPIPERLPPPGCAG